MLKFGIVGYGKMGQVRHDAIKRTDIGEVVSMYGFGDDPVVPEMAAETPESVFNNPDVDAVFICAVNSLNKELTIKALQAGKHVFCEKPPAFNADDVVEIRTIEEQCGKVLMYGFNHRHHGAAVKMKQVIEQGELGKVL